MITEEYLKARGFKKDNTCPAGVNRWEKQEGEGWDKQWWASVTLKADGSETLYGVVNFYTICISGSQPYNYISKHKKFNGPISIPEFNRFLTR